MASFTYWLINEVPCRAPPLPEHLVKTMAGWFSFKGHYSFGILFLVGFYSMLRTGEIVNLRSSSIISGPRDKQILISLGLTKAGKRQGAAESVMLDFQPVVLLAKRWKSLVSPSATFVLFSAKWRTLFSKYLSALNLEAFNFRPYSLRRGGATFWFSKHHSLDRLLIQGRWAL